MKISAAIIDAFTEKAFKGNPAGVCLLDHAISESLMQSIAAEFNLSETAFIVKKTENESSIRFFTPEVEVPFCGHASLASSKFMLDKFNLQSIIFANKHGLIISATHTDDGILIKFPLYDTEEFKCPPALIQAIGIDGYINTRYSKDTQMILVQVENINTIINLKPDYTALKSAYNNIHGVIVTAASHDNKFDFYSRYFCPWLGLTEDPVTGAAHTILAKYWGDILNKKEMNAYQASKRGGAMKLILSEPGILHVIGKAVTVLEGTMSIEE